MLEGMIPPDRGRPCAVRTLLNTLDESDQKILVGALEADITVWGHVPLQNALRDRGIILLEQCIRKHRARRCSCEPVRVD